MTRVDLHTHSTKSDGTYSPSELVDYAVEKGLSAIALTDHDTVDGLDEALGRAKYYESIGTKIEVIPGIEFSSEYYGQDVHIVGLYINHNSEYFKRRLAGFVASRNKRNVIMCNKLTAHGMPVTYEELLAEFPESVITRAHYAKFLLKKGYVKSIKEAFDRYIGDRCPCYVPRKKISPFRAVEIIRRAGGFPVLAHPVLYGMSKERLNELVRQLKGAGLMGIEALYSTYQPSDERDMRKLADIFALAISGGSDFHGANKVDIDLAVGKGKLYIPDEILDKIKKEHESMLEDNEKYRLPKVLFTDLDGTLLKDDKTISSFTYEVIKEWVNAGHYFALCSGRDINSVRKVKEDLGLDLPNIFAIGYNGGQIYDCTNQETVHKVTLKTDQVNYLYKKAKEAGIYIQTYSDENIIVDGITKETEYYQKVIKTPVKISEDFSIDEAPCKCLLIELEDLEKLEAFRLSILPWAEENDIALLYSNPNYVEVFPKKSGKGSAVRNLVSMLDVPGMISVAAGDEQNDVSMLEAADLAIAMLNGTELVKEAASVITDCDNNDDGLAKILVDVI